MLAIINSRTSLAKVACNIISNAFLNIIISTLQLRVYTSPHPEIHPSLAKVECTMSKAFLNIIRTIRCSVPQSTQMSVHPPTYTLGYSTIHLIWHFCPNLLLGYMCLLLSATCVATYFENLSKRQIQSLFISFAL